MDLHIKAHHLNHWLLSLYAFKYLHYSVTLSSRGGTNILVFTDLNLGKKNENMWESLVGIMVDGALRRSLEYPTYSLRDFLNTNPGPHPRPDQRPKTLEA